MAYGVLVVEDEAILAKNIQLYLKPSDYDVRTAENAAEGMRLVESFKPDLVLLGLQLPDRNGMEILPKIGLIDSDIKVIIITAHGNVQVAVDAMKSGAYDYLSKPLIRGVLLVGSFSFAWKLGDKGIGVLSKLVFKVCVLVFYFVFEFLRLILKIVF
ncbi:MAG: response regulator [Nitrospiria bacterium]